MKRRPFILRTCTLLFLSSLLCIAGCRKDHIDAGTETGTGTTGDKKSGLLTTARVPASETLQTLANGTFLIVNRKSGMMLDVASAATANGSTVLQWGGTGGTNQRWTLNQLADGYYSITGVQSGRALEVYQAGTSDGDKVDIWDYSGGANQQWQFMDLGNGYYRIVNRNSGKDLEVIGQSETPGTHVDQLDYSGGENQQWGLLQPTFSGQLTWTLTSTDVPADVQTRITNAMNAACARYNSYANWPARTLTVEYNTGVATADGSTNGNIRFGPTASYQAVRTAMHEIGHTYGVGLSSGWTANISGGLFIGTTAVDAIHSFDGASAVINTGGGHFWPYGLNYDNEWSETNAYRHVKMIWAMRADGM